MRAKHTLCLLSCKRTSNSAECGLGVPLHRWRRRGPRRKVTLATKIQELVRFTCNQLLCSKTQRKRYSYSQVKITWANQEAIRGLWNNYRQTMVLKLMWFVQETYKPSITHPKSASTESFPSRRVRFGWQFIWGRERCCGGRRWWSQTASSTYPKYLTPTV